MKTIIIITWLFFTSYLSYGQNVILAEYFLDTDLGFGNNILVNVSPSPDGTFPLNINLSNVPTGYHKLYFRTKDSDGKWSITSRKNIEIIPSPAPIVTNGEYFFDADPGYAAAIPIVISPQGEAILQNFTPAVNGLSVGYHKLYIRLKDVNNKWGQTARRNVEIVNAPLSVVKGGEYFFISDPGFGNAFGVMFTDPSPDGTFTFKIPVENIPAGAKTLYVRLKDSVNQNWSFTKLYTDSVITSVQTGLWSDVNTWSNHKIPDSKTIVILLHDVIVDIDGFCRSLVPYRNNVHVTVNQGKILNISGH